MNTINDTVSQILVRLNSLADIRFGSDIEVRQFDIQTVRDQINYLMNMSDGRIKSITDFCMLVEMNLDLLYESDMDPNYGRIYMCKNPNVFRENIKRMQTLGKRISTDSRLYRNPYNNSNSYFTEPRKQERKKMDYETTNKRSGAFMISGFGVVAIIVASINGVIWDGTTWLIMLAIVIGPLIYIGVQNGAE